jgi:SAM-dependent methyltransferase
VLRRYLSQKRRSVREVAGAVVSIERHLSAAPMTPVETYVHQSSVTSTDGLFHPSYVRWTVLRLTKILELYGVEYFPGRRVLELGSGHGDIGAFFADLGADVLCLDGRAKNVNLAKLKHRKVSGVTFERFDLEQDFRSFGRFDLVLDMGLLYHLEAVDSHLQCCFDVTDEIILETAVCDSLDPHLIVFPAENPDVDEESLHGMGSRPSPFYVERLAVENGFAVVPCFTPDLNAGPQFRYDWKHRDDGRAPEDVSLRRFWRLTRSAVSPET